MYFGCLVLLLVGIFFIALNILGGIAKLLGSTVIYLWDSLCNLFCPKSRRRETHNPFSPGDSSSSTEYTSEAHGDSTTPDKVFDASDGEYVDFEGVD